MKSKYRKKNKKVRISLTYTRKFGKYQAKRSLNKYKTRIPKKR